MFTQSIGPIAGTVVDPTPAVITGASITCTNGQTGLKRVTKPTRTAFSFSPIYPLEIIRWRLPNKALRVKKGRAFRC
jgi:hypothetical protein